MKISIGHFCKTCYEEAKKQGKEYIVQEKELAFVELNELGVYYSSCPKGHPRKMIVNQHLFQILFDLGTLALSDSYTREAVSSFSSSMERYFEYIIKLLSFSDNMDDIILQKLWDKISKQSERQFGAYLYLYSNKIQKTPMLPSNKWVKFRNDVIHNGKIPSEVQALEYGQLVSNIILDGLFDTIKYLKYDFGKCDTKVKSFNQKQIQKQDQDIVGVTYSHNFTLINFSLFRKDQPLEPKRIDLSKIIKELKDSNRIIKLSYLK